MLTEQRASLPFVCLETFFLGVQRAKTKNLSSETTYTTEGSECHECLVSTVKDNRRFRGMDCVVQFCTAICFRSNARCAFFFSIETFPLFSV